MKTPFEKKKHFENENSSLSCQLLSLSQRWEVVKPRGGSNPVVVKTYRDCHFNDMV
jgi:hypothetical protein